MNFSALQKSKAQKVKGQEDGTEKAAWPSKKYCTFHDLCAFDEGGRGVVDNVQTVLVPIYFELISNLAHLSTNLLLSQISINLDKFLELSQFSPKE